MSAWGDMDEAAAKLEEMGPLSEREKQVARILMAATSEFYDWLDRDGNIRPEAEKVIDGILEGE